MQKSTEFANFLCGFYRAESADLSTGESADLGTGKSASGFEDKKLRICLNILQ